MDAMRKELTFYTIKTDIAAFKATVRSYVFGGTSQLPDKPQLPDEWLNSVASAEHPHTQDITAIKESRDAALRCADAIIEDYNGGNTEKAKAELLIFDLKADKLLLLLQVLELKLNTDASIEKIDVALNEDEEGSDFIDLEKSLKNLNYLYKEQTEELSKTKHSAQKTLQNYFSQAPIGICILRGSDFIVEVANPLYLQLVEKDEAFLHKPLFESLPVLKDQPIKGILERVYNSGIAYVGYEQGVYLMRNSTKELTYFNFVYQPLFEDDGSVSGIIVICTEVSHMVNAKNRLLEKEKEFRNLVMQSPIAMAIFRGEALTIEVANKTMLNHLWRKEFGEVEGKSILEVFPELKEQKYPELLRGVMQSGIPHRENEAVAYVDSHDGRKTYYLDYEYAPLYDLDGTINGIMCTVDDATDRVMARRAKEMAQQKQANLIENLPVAMYTIDANGYIDLFNKEAEILWGRRPQPGKDRWCGSYRLSTLNGTPISHDECPMALAFKEGKSIREEIYMIRENGEKRHVIVHPRALYDDDGNVIGASKVMLDITESKIAEEALRKSEEKFRLLASSVPQFIWTVDQSNKLDYLNHSLIEYSGHTEEELRNGAFSGMVHPDDKAENTKRWQQSLRDASDFMIEHRLRRKDGEYRWFLCRASAHTDIKGTILQWVGTSTDIHDQKTFQQTLEKLVNERTTELQKANTELESMNKELASFAYVSSHDLQEPLRKIQTFGSIIMANEYDNLSDSGKRNFDRMQVAARRMTRLIADLLAYSRTNASEDAFEETDLNTLLQEVAFDASETLHAKGGVINVSTMPTVRAIPFQIRQLFNNLISNALKFSKEGVPPVITILGETVPGNAISANIPFPEKEYLHISVQDNGIGFEPEYAHKIFEVFQRLHGKEQYEGTGIGLAICTKIAENHKGAITAESDRNGATFHIYLPL